MEEMFVQISMSKIIDIILHERDEQIRKHYMDTLGKSTADLMDSFVAPPSHILSFLKA